MERARIIFIAFALAFFSLSFFSVSSFADAEVSPVNEPIILDSQEELGAPGYVPNQFIVKLKDGKTLDDLKGLNELYGVTSMEMIFPDLPNPNETLKNLKDKLAHLTKEHESWYWQLDKNSAEFKEYTARIAKEKAGLEEQIRLQEKLSARQKLASKNNAPRLDNIYFFNTSIPNVQRVVEAYRKSPAVEYAEPNVIIKLAGFPQDLPNDTYIKDMSGANQWRRGSWLHLSQMLTINEEYMWGMKKIIESGGQRAWAISQGEGVVVAVIDSGVDYNHEDIAANMWKNQAELNGAAGVDDDGNGYVDDIYGFDFYNKDSDPIDDNGHGTHCAGIIAAIGNNAKGVIGVAPQAKIMAVKVFPPSSGKVCFSPGAPTEAVAKAVYYAVANGADVLSNSWGGGNSQVLRDVLDFAVKNNIVVVCAAGNDNESVDSELRSDIAGLIVVAATNQNDMKATFSYNNPNSASNWGAKIDVAAPGVEILSLQGSNCGSDIYQRVTPGSNYAFGGGTSAACPHVAGVAALLLAKNPGLPPIQVENIIKTVGDPLPANVAGGKPFCSLRTNAKKVMNASMTGLCFVKITSPDPGSQLHNQRQVDIKGLAYGDNFASFKLEYAPVGSGIFTDITAINNRAARQSEGTLGTLDMGNFADAAYKFKLTVTNTKGATFIAQTQVEVNNAELNSPLDDEILSYTRPIEIKGIATGNDFKNYTLKILKAGQELWLLSGNAKKDKPHALLGTFNPASVIRDSGAYQIELTVSYNNGRQEGAVRTINFDKGLKPGWPVRFTNDIYYEFPLCAMHLNIAKAGGNSKKLVLASYEKIYLLDPAGLADDDYMEEIVAGSPYAGPAVYLSVGDLDMDNADEIVTPMYFNADSYFKCDAYKLNGERVNGWPETFDKVNIGLSVLMEGLMYPVIGDIDNAPDRKPEIAFHAYDKFLLSTGNQAWYLLKNNGQLYDSRFWPVAHNLSRNTWPIHASYMEPAIADLNSDGKKEIIAWSDASGVMALNENGGLLFTTNQPAHINKVLRSPLVADLDQDGFYEIILGGPEGKLYVFDHKGQLKDVKTGGCGQIQNIAIGNIDADPSLEIVVRGINMNEQGCLSPYKIYVYKYQDGQLNLTADIALSSCEQAFSDLVIGNVDAARPGCEILTGTHNGLSAFTLTATGLEKVWEKRTRYAGAFPVKQILLNDIDSDGKIEIIAYNSQTNIFVWATGVEATGENMQWPQAKHDGQHTGCFGPATGNPPAQGNHAPSLSPIKDQVVPEGQRLTIALTGSDMDADPLTYEIVAVDGVNGAALDHARIEDNKFIWDTDYDQAGSHQIQFRVSDNKGASSDVVTARIIVTGVVMPPSAITMREGETIEYNLAVYDANNMPVPITSQYLKSWMKLEDPDNDKVYKLTIAPGASDSGAYNIRLFGQFKTADGCWIQVLKTPNIVVNEAILGQDETSITVKKGTEPLSGVRVVALLNGRGPVLTTNAEGKIVTKLPPGRYVFTATYRNLTFTKEGYAPGQFEIAIPRDTVITVTKNGNPLSAYNVYASKEGKSYNCGKTNSQGRVICTLPVGSGYTFIITYGGKQYKQTGSSESQITIAIP